MVRSLVLAIAIATLLVSGCSRQPRTPPMTSTQAMAASAPMELRVIKVWNVVTDALSHDREPGISHYVEVDVVSGPSTGQQFTLPYDEWNVGKAPPAVGTTVVLAPADWVRRSKDTRGRPFGGW